MVTPKKATVPFKQDQLHYSEQSPPASSELNATFPRVVHVAEAGHVSRQIEFSSSPVQPSGLGENVTMETLSEISRASHVSHHVNDPVSDHMSDHVSDHVSEHASDHMMPKHVLDQPARIQLTLPSAEPGVSMISEGLLGSDESAAEISSISGGEIYWVVRLTCFSLRSILRVEILLWFSWDHQSNSTATCERVQVSFSTSLLMASMRCASNAQTRAQTNRSGRQLALGLLQARLHK